MAQISIPMSNKVGYSMFWNSMWDNKINYSRSLKEDIFLNMFIPYLFEDKISTKIIKTFDYENLIKKFNLKNYNLHLKINHTNKKIFYKYMSDLNKVNYFSAKIWILKYQKWVIIYFFMYIPKFNYLKNDNIVKSEKYEFNNLNNIFILYKMSYMKLKYSYNFFNDKKNKTYF